MSKKEEKKWLQKCLKRKKSGCKNAYKRKKGKKVTAKNVCKRKRGLQKPESVQMWKENFILCGVLIFCYPVFVWETTFLRYFYAVFMHS